ncbi:hypothetical protein MMC27_007019 [Xylographa pallens]|nr:hypothetical protein [Xylographa pallens]
MATPVTTSPDVLITIKLLVGTENRRFKLPLRDLGANSLPDKLRSLLAVPPTKNIVFERYSDSAGTYITLDSNNPSVYKQLYRAAKAKLKLRIKATVTGPNVPKIEEPVTPDRLTSHRYVPPMNPDPLRFALSQTSDTLPTVTPVTPIPSIQATGGHFTAEESARILQQNVPSLSTRAAPSAPPKAVIQPKIEPKVEPKIEAPVTIKQEVEEEAPTPRAFTDREQFYSELSKLSKACRLRASEHSFHVPGAAFTVCCNSCTANIPDAHWHCSICEDGDYDLCRHCVTSGVHCGVAGHFLIKRSIENGRVISSTTETVPKKVVKVEAEKEVPGAYTTEIKEEHLPEMVESSRTCNSCVNVFEESNFVTCMICDDYDLCIPCHVDLKHGHHPNHTFAPVSDEVTLDAMASQLCAPGRNMRHFAICDGCDKDIYGVRHKCLNCPDWDYCSACVKNARHGHPGHRFVPIYETIATPSGRAPVHVGINCDGPLCKDKKNSFWIAGDRFKCAVCHDTDFCASCEALPTNRHNRTHPLIKFRTPVRNVSVTTFGEKENGDAMCTMGDKLPTPAPTEKSPQTSSKSTETMPSAPSANAATQVQTVAEVKPVEPVREEPENEESRAPAQLQAHFVRDTVADGSKVPAGCQLQQVWVLRNPGPAAWPAGCSVRFVGGDNNMLNVSSSHPSTINDIGKAIESNVMSREVEVGEEVCFFVTIKAPQRPGKAISYWRLKAADGTPFGHRLWCDIDVVKKLVFDPKGITSTQHIEDVDAPQAPPAVEVPQFQHVEDISKEHEAQDAAVSEDKSVTEEHQSQMIFPKLDKESPVSSTHEAQSTEQRAAPPSSIASEERGLLEDVESLELEDDETSDDGFLTDEEYEILDADVNDEAAVNGKK